MRGRVLIEDCSWKEYRIKKRRITKSRLKPECVDQYREYHAAVWPELLELYRMSGILAISCFLNGTELLVSTEMDAEVYEKHEADMKANDTGVRWQALMKSFRDSSVKQVEYEEVFIWVTQTQIKGYANGIIRKAC